MGHSTDQRLVHKVICDVAGDAGMLAMQEARGGTEILVPLNPGPESWFSQILGHEVALEVSRRLTVIDADGRRTCGMRAYIPRGQTRLQELRAQIRTEIVEKLMSGMSVRDTAIAVRVAERDVSRERQSLIAIGKLKSSPQNGKRRTAMLSVRAPMLLLPTPSRPDEIITLELRPVDDRKQLWEIRNAIADDGILKGHSTRHVSMAAEVSPSYVRIRRKILIASGRLKPGRIGAPRTSPDHSANIGEMVGGPSHEVRP